MGLVLVTMLFQTATTTFDLPPNLLSALCYVESSHNTTAVHHDDGKGASLGICQIKFPTAQLMGFKGTKKDLMLPANNIYYAGKYLKKQLSRYNGDVRKAVAAYNAGTYKENKQGININKLYVSRVFLAWLKNK